MKKLLSLLLAAMLLLPMMGAWAEGPSILDELRSLADFGFLADLGILKEEEAELLAAGRLAVENGRELVREGKITSSAVTGVPEDDAALAALLERITLVSRSQRSEEHFEVLLDGELLASFGYGEQDGLWGLSSSLLNGTVTLSAEDVAALPNRLVTAAQANGLLTRQEAMQYGMTFAAMSTGSGSTLLQLLQAVPADCAALDLSAWNAVLTDVRGRMAYTDVTEQPADCDAAVKMWTLTVTAKDICDFLVAGIRTLRDNPALVDFLAELTGYERSGQEGAFAEAFIDPLLAELEAAEELIPANLALTGYEDEAGELVRLEILVLDAGAQTAIGTDADFSDAARSAPVLQLVCNRRTTENMVIRELLFGDDRLEAYVQYVNRAPFAMYALSHTVTAGRIGEEGARSIDYVATLNCVVNDTIPGLIEADFQLSLMWPDLAAASASEGRRTWAQRDCFLIVSVVHGGVRERYPRDCGSIIFRTTDRRGAEVLDGLGYTFSFERDGVDLTGTESFTWSRGEEPIITYTADVRTRTPEGSLFAGEAVRLNALTDDELAAWVGGVKETVEAWLVEASAALPAFLTEPDGGQAQDDPR